MFAGSGRYCRTTAKKLVDLIVVDGYWCKLI